MTFLRSVSLTTAAAWLLGLFYLLSGVGKALDVGLFTVTIADYGLPQLTPLVPLLIALELALGAALLLRVQLRQLALLSALLLVFFTALFAYGYLVRGVTDCGCFGAIDSLALPPALSVLRNALLLGVSLWLYRRTAAADPGESQTRLRLALLASVLAVGVARTAYAHRTKPDKVGVVQGQPVSGSLLAPYLPATKDSTYLVFVFSPTCSHCWHATPIVASYQDSGAVDRVIGLYAAQDTAAIGSYRRKYHPPFGVRNVDLAARRAISFRVPLAVLVRGGVLQRVMKPPFPPADSLRMLLAQTPAAP